MIIKPATMLSEFLQIHQLNYKTFVEEIPQHQHNPEKKLVDKFHNKNKYIIAKREETVIGMVSYNCERPFSLDEKITNLDQYLPKHSKLAEIRLLSVSTEERKTMVAYRLLQYLSIKLIHLGIDAAVISGTTRQLQLYSRIGFIPFGTLVGSGEASYQPMYVTLNELRNDFRNS
ncbi:MAG TPA: GNAT family N-acetyltransferase [Chitinophagaceae bacterium]|nr:GNAT family N-acetyltransferase [Chitinophagaceae bacterium]